MFIDFTILGIIRNDPTSITRASAACWTNVRASSKRTKLLDRTCDAAGKLTRRCRLTEKVRGVFHNAHFTWWLTAYDLIRGRQVQSRGRIITSRPRSVSMSARTRKTAGLSSTINATPAHRELKAVLALCVRTQSSFALFPMMAGGPTTREV
jgi:hypothetical protein